MLPGFIIISFNCSLVYFINFLVFLSTERSARRVPYHWILLLMLVRSFSGSIQREIQLRISIFLNWISLSSGLKNLNLFLLAFSLGKILVRLDRGVLLVVPWVNRVFLFMKIKGLLVEWISFLFCLLIIAGLSLSYNTKDAFIKLYFLSKLQSKEIELVYCSVIRLGLD